MHIVCMYVCMYVCVCIAGIMIGHVTPEAYDGGPIALVEEGDSIIIDMSSKTISLVCKLCISWLSCHFILATRLQDIEESLLLQRKLRWQPLKKKLPGLLSKYRSCVKSAHYGATTY